MAHRNKPDSVEMRKVARRCRKRIRPREAAGSGAARCAATSLAKGQWSSSSSSSA
jgi:hypothetical protein